MTKTRDKTEVKKIRVFIKILNDHENVDNDHLKCEQEKNHTAKEVLLLERRTTKAHRRLVLKFDFFFLAEPIENILFRALKIKSILKLNSRKTGGLTPSESLAFSAVESFIRFGTEGLGVRR